VTALKIDALTPMPNATNQASAHYTPQATTWVKIKNRQTAARRLLFKGRDIASLAAIIEKVWRWTGLADDS